MKKYNYYLILFLLLFSWQGYAQSGLQVQETTKKKDIVVLETNFQPEEGALVIDGRSETKFKYSHLPGSINIMENKFGLFISKLVDPQTEFYIVADEPESLTELVEQVDAVGYTSNIKGVFLYNLSNGEKMDQFRYDLFIRKQKKYTIVDIRSREEHKENPIFKKSINIPLEELEDRAGEIPTKKPIVVHCATGYRSAIGSSILNNHIQKQKVFDMGANVDMFTK